MPVAASSAEDDSWEDRLADGGGFSQQEVQALLEAEREHLWLWHPRTPFRQRVAGPPGVHMGGAPA